jgi:hypothetical protein
VDEGCSLEFEVTYSATRVRQSSGNRFAAAAASCAHISTQYPLTVPMISAGGGGSQRNISGVLMPSPKNVGMDVGISRRLFEDFFQGVFRGIDALILMRKT